MAEAVRAMRAVSLFFVTPGMGVIYRVKVRNGVADLPVVVDATCSQPAHKRDPPQNAMVIFRKVLEQKLRIC
jgi:hypothetical protein